MELQIDLIFLFFSRNAAHLAYSFRKKCIFILKRELELQMREREIKKWRFGWMRERKREREIRYLWYWGEREKRETLKKRIFFLLVE